MIKYDIQETLHFQKRAKMGPLYGQISLLETHMCW